MPKEINVHRSGLTMPVVTPRFVDNAWRRGCDFINLDLEDSVPHTSRLCPDLDQGRHRNVTKAAPKRLPHKPRPGTGGPWKASFGRDWPRSTIPRRNTPKKSKSWTRIITRLERERGYVPERWRSEPISRLPWGCGQCL